MKVSFFLQKESGQIFINWGGTAKKEIDKHKKEGNLFLGEAKIKHKKTLIAANLIKQLEKSGLDSEVFYALLGEIATAAAYLAFPEMPR